ncbi:type VI secretion system-associated protein [Pandoraea horticolens]|uniref:Type VI secretion system-associated protein n=1 Tax=Pandoraea horticolens TaxID=2508298 RepID=A0A5E4YUQ8_9BURK|nr:type VI secretion system contractile sheath small subunit [Pandoraea horticolens]VVE52187.1 type VI secretion system-associated protein [Pandoraea horticolens]
MADEKGSAAPRERVNIVYKSATGDAKEDVELPFKQLVLGDFTLRASDVPLDERDTIQIDRDNFDGVMKAQGLSLTLSVPNRLINDTALDESLDVKLKFESLRDFEPDALVEQVPELKQLIELRSALKALMGPLGNLPAFRKRIEMLIAEPQMRERLLAELGVGESTKE